MSNKGLWIGIGTAVVLGGIATGAYFWLRKREEKDSDVGGKTSGNENSGESIGSDSYTMPVSSSPFKNREEGDSFRLWMSVNYPNYRFRGDKLDLSGSHTNAWILDAYSKYGSEYEASKSVKANEAVAENLSKELRTNKSNLFQTLSDGSKIVAITFDVSNKKYGARFFDNGRVWVDDVAVKKSVLKGNYTLGGKKITITEGYNKGKTFNAPTVIGNLKASVANFSNFANEEYPSYQPKMGVFSSPFEF